MYTQVDSFISIYTWNAISDVCEDNFAVVKTNKKGVFLQYSALRIPVRGKIFILSFFSLKSLNIYQQQRYFLLHCKISCHYKSLTPSKSMPQKSNHDFEEKYRCVRVGTLVSMLIKEILTKNSCFYHGTVF